MTRTAKLIFSVLLAMPVFAAEPTDAPTSLQAAPGHRLLLEAHGVGDQIYTCKQGADGKYAWTLKAPDARLMGPDSQLLGKHYAGPTWEAKDGSSVQAKPVANSPAPDGQSVPWLLLNATAHGKQGVMTNVSQIQRLHTQGGKAPAAGCDDSHPGVETRVGYQADYYFYGGESK